MPWWTGTQTQIPNETSVEEFNELAGNTPPTGVKALNPLLIALVVGLVIWKFILKR